MRSFLRAALSLLSPTLRRRTALKNAPFPQEWEAILRRWMPYFERLPSLDQELLRHRILVFCSEKRFEGCGGLSITDEIRLLIAAQACVLILHKDTNYYPKVSAILVYPSHFRVPNSTERAGEVLSGEAWRMDYIVLAWDSVRRGAYNASDGRNLVYHEFSHQLDVENGTFDGIPALPSSTVSHHWREVVTREFRALREAASAGRPSVLDHYGATNEAEFFAVATEAFFERPRELKTRHRRLYELLSVYYEQDPCRCGSMSTLKIRRRDWPLTLLGDSARVTETNDVIRAGERAFRLFLGGMAVVLAPFYIGIALFPRSQLPILGLYALVALCTVVLSSLTPVPTKKKTTLRNSRTLQLELVEADPSYGLSKTFYDSQVAGLSRIGFQLLAQFRDLRTHQSSGLAFESVYAPPERTVLVSIPHYDRERLCAFAKRARSNGSPFYIATHFSDNSELLTTTDPSVSSHRPPEMRLSVLPQNTSIDAALSAHQAEVAALIENQFLVPRAANSIGQVLRQQRQRFKRLQRFENQALS